MITIRSVDIDSGISDILDFLKKFVKSGKKMSMTLIRVNSDFESVDNKYGFKSIDELTHSIGISLQTANNSISVRFFNTKKISDKYICIGMSITKIK